MCRFKPPSSPSLCLFLPFSLQFFWIEKLNNRHVLIRCAVLLGLINENHFLRIVFYALCQLSFSPYCFFFVWFVIDACHCTRVQTTHRHTYALSCRFIREYYILLGSTQAIIYIYSLKHRVHFKFQLQRRNISTLTTYFTIILSQHYIWVFWSCVVLLLVLLCFYCRLYPFASIQNNMDQFVFIKIKLWSQYSFWSTFLFGNRFRRPICKRWRNIKRARILRAPQKHETHKMKTIKNDEWILLCKWWLKIISVVRCDPYHIFLYHFHFSLDD